MNFPKRPAAELSDPPPTGEGNHPKVVEGHGRFTQR